MNVEWLTFGAARLVERLLLASADVVLLGVLVWGLLRVFRRCPPRLAAMLWLLVLAKPLMTLALGPGASLLAVSLPWGVHRPAAVAASGAPVVSPPVELPPVATQGPEVMPVMDEPDEVPTGALEAADAPDARSGVIAPEPRHAEVTPAPSCVAMSGPVPEVPWHAVPEPADQAPDAAERTGGALPPVLTKADRLAERPARRFSSGAWLIRAVAAVWIVGVLWGIAGALVRFLLLRRRIARCPAVGDELKEVYAAAVAEMGYRRRPVRLVAGSLFPSPALIGCWRPVIVLPEWFARQGDNSQIGWAVKHEVAHLLHGDPWGDLLRRVVRTLFFFHPVVHLAARCWEAAAEAACDRALVREERDVVDYTECLLSIVQRVGSSRLQRAPLGLFATGTQIQQRINRLLSMRSRDFAPLPARFRWLVLPAILLIFCGFSLAQQAEDQPAASATTASAEASTPPHEAAPQDETALPKETAPQDPPGSLLESLQSALDEAADSAPPQIKAGLDAATAELLTKILLANRYWFEGPPRRVPSYRYAFVLRDGRRQEFKVDDPRTAGAWVKRGITYAPLSGVVLKALAEKDTASIERLERSDKEIKIEFKTDGSLGTRLGGGVSGTWHGFIYYKLGNGTLRLDAKTLMPIELLSTHRDENSNKETVVTEKLSEPAKIDPGHWAPLRVEAVRLEKEYRDGQVTKESTSRFDWTFRVYEPGLWLFDAEPAAGGTAVGYHLEDVVIGDAEKPLTQAASETLAAMEESRKKAAQVVEQYVDANRAWLLPDLERRKGLVYDYHQEDGYRERIIFDQQGNILAQLASERKSNKSPSSAQQRFYTADGREIFGTVGESFVTIGDFDPNSTSPFSGRKILNNLATGWGWECASMRLARGPDDFGTSVDMPPEAKNWRLTLRPVRNKPNLHIGTMLCFVSWAYLPSRSFERCEIEIDRESRRPIQESYFNSGESEPFCTIRFEDWLDTPEGKAPGKVVGHSTYRKRGERDPKTRKYQYIDEVFDFTGVNRVTETGLLLLNEATSTFKTTESGSTGRVTLVEATDEDYRPVKDLLERVEATTQFLENAEKASRGIGKTVACRWGETVPVWLNGKYGHQATGQGNENREPPYRAYQKNLGVQNLLPEVLNNGKVRVTANVYSTIYYEGYNFDLTVGLVDAEGRTLAEQTASEKTQTMNRPEQKPVVFDFNDTDPDAVASVAVSLHVKQHWGSLYYRGKWITHTASHGAHEIPYLPGGRDWGPEQAIGEPEDRRIGGDYTHAWSSLTEDGREEWLELTYRNRVPAIGVNVYETFNPGAVCKVTYYNDSGEEQVAWQGKDPTPVDVETAWGVSRIRFDKPAETDRVRIYLDSPAVKGWNEIDAVGLVEASSDGSPEREHWARDAQASSTFAEGPRPETVTYQYDGPHTELKYDEGFRDWVRSLGGGAWQVIQFTRPKDKPYLDAVRVLASYYGSRNDNVTLYVLDEDMNVMEELTRESTIPSRGPMKWYLFHVPSAEVPETFYVAFQFNSQQRSGIYVGTRQLGENEPSHSFSYSKGHELTPLEVNGVGYDWMIRAYMAATPNEKAREEAEARKKREAAKAAIAAKGRGWGPEQATGEPDADDWPKGGDYQSAWASKTEDAQAEWLELTYSKRVKALGVDIYETYNPGAVCRVSVYDADGNEKTAWEGSDPTPAGIAGGKGLSKIRFAEPVETERVRIYLDSVNVKGWNEIDAVGLVESESAVHWAKSAEASSTYAR